MKKAVSIILILVTALLFSACKSYDTDWEDYIRFYDSSAENQCTDIAIPQDVASRIIEVAALYERETGRLLRTVDYKIFIDGKNFCSVYAIGDKCFSEWQEEDRTYFTELKEDAASELIEIINDVYNNRDYKKRRSTDDSREEWNTHLLGGVFHPVAKNCSDN